MIQHNFRPMPTFRVWFSHPALSFRVLGTGPTHAAAMYDAELRAAQRLERQARLTRVLKLTPREFDKRALARGEWS